MSKISKAAALKIFDQAVAKIMEQGKPSISAGGVCLYRGPDGLKCAAGHFIPDSKYSKDMEKSRIDIVNSKFKLGFSASKLAGLFHAQNAHDNAYFDVNDGLENSFIEAFQKRVKESRAQLEEECREQE